MSDFDGIKYMMRFKLNILVRAIISFMVKNVFRNSDLIRSNYTIIKFAYLVYCFVPYLETVSIL